MAISGYVQVSPNSYVQLVDASGTSYVSGQSDDNGDWSINAPAGSYTINTGPTVTGPWTALPNVASYVVANATDSAGDLTPSGAVFPGTGGGAAQTAAGIIAGTGAPANGTGKDGWIYIRSDGGSLTTIYQRRSGAWVGIV